MNRLQLHSLLLVEQRVKSPRAASQRQPALSCRPLTHPLLVAWRDSPRGRRRSRFNELAEGGCLGLGRN